KRRGKDRLRVLDVDVALTQLRVAEVSVPNQLVSQCPADAGYVEHRRGVLQDRKVPLVEDVLQVVVVRLGLRVWLVEALVARATGELCQHVSVGANPIRCHLRRELVDRVVVNNGVREKGDLHSFLSFGFPSQEKAAILNRCPLMAREAGAEAPAVPSQVISE